MATATTTKQTKAEPKKSPEERRIERRERFVRLAPKRVNNALTSLSRVEHLSNHATYDFEAVEAAKIIQTLQDAVDAVENAFSKSKADKPSFTL